MSGQDWREVSERLKAQILAQFGHYATFARLVAMEPTQLSATLKPTRRPEPETLDRFSEVLGWEPAVLRSSFARVVITGRECAIEPVPLLERLIAAKEGRALSLRA